MNRKNLDIIVANDVSGEQTGFASDDNASDVGDLTAARSASICSTTRSSLDGSSTTHCSSSTFASWTICRVKRNTALCS